MRSWDRYLSLLKTIGIEDVDESIKRAIRVKQLMTIVHDRAVIRTRDPQMMTAVGLKEIAELFQQTLRIVIRQFRIGLVSSRFILTVPRYNEDIEKTKRFMQKLDKFDHQLYMAATRTD